MHMGCRSQASRNTGNFSLSVLLHLHVLSLGHERKENHPAKECKCTCTSKIKEENDPNGIRTSSLILLLHLSAVGQTRSVASGSAYGDRTRAPALRGLCPNH